MNNDIKKALIGISKKLDNTDINTCAEVIKKDLGKFKDKSSFLSLISAAETLIIDENILLAKLLTLFEIYDIESKCFWLNCEEEETNTTMMMKPWNEGCET